MLHLVLPIAIALWLGLSANPSEDGAGGPERLERRLEMMGTDVTISVEAESRSEVLAATAIVVEALERTESRLSTWREDSEVSRLNRAAEESWQPLSVATRRELRAAETCRRLTAAGFDLAAGSLVDLWRDEGRTQPPSSAEIAQALPPQGVPRVLFDSHGRGRRNTGIAALTVGAFGKGAAAQLAIQDGSGAPGVVRLRIDLGGQVTRWSTLKEPAFERLADPARRAVPVLEIEMPYPAMATSGNSEQRRVLAGIPVGHLIDPRTGYPADDFGSITVWTRDALLADCLSTGLFVLGPNAGMATAEVLPEVEALVLLREADGVLRALATTGLAGRLHPLTRELHLSYTTGSDRPSPARTKAHRSPNPRPTPLTRERPQVRRTIHAND